MKRILANLSVRQRITIVLAALSVAAALYGAVRWQQEADFRPLFTGLSAEDAAGIMQKLKEGGTDYRLGEGGGTILAPSARIAELRITLAASGLPKTGRIGFELFDKANLGATEFAEQVNFRRALEGELERSVMSLAEVEQARVHITFPKDSVFLDQQQPAKASVLVRLKPGSRLAPPECARYQPPGGKRRRGAFPRRGIGHRYERKPARPAQTSRFAGRGGAFRGQSGLPPQDGGGRNSQDQRHARTAAGGG